jgi:AcrR family transcriptional regulator
MPRRYLQRVRAETVEHTRRRILEAARAVLVGKARPELTLGEVAVEAGIARSTIYAAFGTRAGLLAALFDDSLQRAGLPQVIAEGRSPDAVLAIERVLVANCRMYAAEHRVLARLLTLGQLDPEVASLVAQHERSRAAALNELAARLVAQRRARAQMSVERAADVLWLLTSFSTFDVFHRGRGLSADACASLQIEIARAALFAPPQRAEPARDGDLGSRPCDRA